MQELIDYLATFEWWQYVTAAVTIASTVAAVTPTPEEGSVWAKLYKIIDFLAVNVGKAKDKGQQK